MIVKKENVMYKKIIRYMDYSDTPVERVQEFYFYLSNTELKMMNAKVPGGMGTLFQSMVNDMDSYALLTTIEDLILSAYGKRTPDGTSFIKNDQIKAEFKCSAAYDVLFNEITESPEAFADFIKKIVPMDVQQKIADGEKSGNNNMPEIITEIMKTNPDAANSIPVTPVTQG